VNLLRKKTNDEDIARRAKRLVKKWQKLVQNHLEAVRNTNSPLNGIRCNSPIVNGSVENKEQANSPAETATTLDRKSKGTKRKRLSVDSLSPPETQENAGVGDKDNGVSNDKKDETNASQHSDLISEQSSLDSQDILSQENSSTECFQNLETNLLKRIKTEDGECHQDLEKVDNGSLAADKVLPNTTEVKPPTQTNNSDHTDVRWEGKDVGVQTDDIVEQDSQTSVQIYSDSSVDIEHQANGINGRFGEDGNWYSWSDTMSYNEGSLIILPYVLLE
jgi:hypothetical protein